MHTRRLASANLPSLSLVRLWIIYCINLFQTVGAVLCHRAETCLLLFTAGWSRYRWRERGSRWEGSRRRSWRYWTDRTNWAKGRTWFSRTAGECKLLGKFSDTCRSNNDYSHRWNLSYSTSFLAQFSFPLWKMVQLQMSACNIKQGCAREVALLSAQRFPLGI